jgi:CRP/FNR family transcriptional regulator, cyclic AMP receptor protein
MQTVYFEHWLSLNAPLSSYDAGEKIFLQDDAGGRMYLVRSGRVQILTSGTVLENVGPGGLFGEMSLVDDAPRSAAAIALEPTEVAIIDRPMFLALIQQQPECALQVMALLANRIRKMNESM